MSLRFAAIDIGSSAIRLLLSNVYVKKPEPLIKKISLIRVPIRLGEDVFSTGVISDEKTESLIQAMRSFKNLMEVFKIIDFKACATSAMREALNGQNVVAKIKKETGIHIEIINGDMEADIIFSSHLCDQFNDKKSYLYIDVGGGSTELTLFSKDKKIASNSFDIGTVRMLQHKVNKDEWVRLKKWISKNIQGVKNLVAMGTGGNINKLAKLAEKKENKCISFEKLLEVDAYLNKFTYKERVEILGLNPDRADVIIQASKVFLTIMHTADIKKIYVPQVGLSDGIIKTTYEEWMQKNR